MLHVQETGVVTNAEVQKLGNVSKATATRYLSELEDEYLEKMGTTGVGTQYKVKNLLKSDYPQPKDVALTPIFVEHHKFYSTAHAFRAEPHKNMTTPKGRGFLSCIKRAH